MSVEKYECVPSKIHSFKTPLTIGTIDLAYAKFEAYLVNGMGGSFYILFSLNNAHSDLEGVGKRGIRPSSVGLQKAYHLLGDNKNLIST